MPADLARVRFDLVPFTRGKGLDIGRGEHKAFPHFIGVRTKDDALIKAPVTADFAVDDLTAIGDFIEGSLDFIFVWGLDDGARIAEASANLLRIGGFGCLLQGDELRIVLRTEDGFAPLSLTRAPKSVCVMRYGATGDMLQTAALLPQLKREGYHVTVNCHPNGELLLKNDPHVDAFRVQDPNQVPNGELPDYHAHLLTRFDRVINLSESVEGSLLAHPGRVNHRWPDAMRRKYMDVNYLEFMSEIADLPYVPGGHFYPSDEEAATARACLDEIAIEANKGLKFGERSVTPFVIVWALAGSSVHKFYPHMDAVIARIMLEIPHAHVVLLGDEICQILEAGWENEPRVHRMSGKLALRDSLTLATMADCVIGPETGLLNAAAFETNAKVVLLSHSSANNLTRDWTNTEAVATQATPCYPCHRLHYNHDFCPQDAESGAAMCQADLAPSSVWDAVARAYTGWGTVRRLTGKT